MTKIFFIAFVIVAALWLAADVNGAAFSYDATPAEAAEIVTAAR